MADYERKMDKQRRIDDEAACVAAKEYYRRKESGSLPKNPVELKKNAKHLRCLAQAIRGISGKTSG